MSFTDLITNYYPQFLSGMGETLILTLLSLLIAMILGLVTCFFNLSKFKILRIIAAIYVDLIRGTPILVQAFFIYFGLTQALNFRMPAFTAAIIVLSLNAGAYSSEIFRSGIKAINKGQMEAARSLGMSYWRAMYRVVLPQAFRIVVPSLVNQFIITLKDTSILSVIGLVEITKTGQLIIANNFESFKTWTIVAICYLIIIIPLSRIAKALERSMANGKSGSK